MRFFRLLVDIPALDRLVAYLESKDQDAIDAAVVIIDNARLSLQRSRESLQLKVDKGKGQTNAG